MHFEALNAYRLTFQSHKLLRGILRPKVRILIPQVTQNLLLTRMQPKLLISKNDIVIVVASRTATLQRRIKLNCYFICKTAYKTRSIISCILIEFVLRVRGDYFFVFEFCEYEEVSDAINVLVEIHEIFIVMLEEKLRSYYLFSTVLLEVLD